MRPESGLTIPTRSSNSADGGGLAAHGERDPSASEFRPSLRFDIPSLRLVLALALGALGLASTVLLTTLVTREASARLEVEIAAQLEELAEHMARTLDQGMFERWRDIDIVASNDMLRDPAVPLGAKRTMLQRLQQTFPLYSIVGLISPEGQILATSNGLIEGADVSRRAYFLGGRKGPFIGDVHDAVLLASLLPQAPGEPLRLVDIASPVLGADGSLTGVVAGHLNWNWAREVARSFTQSLKGRREGAQILVFARDGTVLIGPPELEGRTIPAKLQASLASAKDQDGSIVADWPDGDGAYVTAIQPTQGYRTYPGLGWTVVVRQRADRALASVADLRWNLLVFGSLVACMAACLAWVLAGRLARPLCDLAGAAVALGRDEPLPALPRSMVKEGRAVAEALVAASAELRRREVARALLVDELNHRVKNTLATVQSLAAQSLKFLTGEAAEKGRATFEARLLALARAHDVLTRENWASADLHDVVAEVVRPYDECGTRRFTVQGPHVRLLPRTALALSMALHELCTNAAKYGALSTAAGGVEIRWQVEDDADGLQLALSWQERGGPPVTPPDRRGFGSRLIERGLASELRGTTQILFERSGVRCTVTASLGAVPA